MKSWKSKYLLLLSFALLFGCVFFSQAKADTITINNPGNGISGTAGNEVNSTTTMPVSGYITGWTWSPSGCDTSCTGAGVKTIPTQLLQNVTLVSTSTGGTGYNPATSTVTGLSIPFNAGDIMSIGCDSSGAYYGWNYPCISATATISYTTALPGLNFIYPAIGTSTGQFSSYILSIAPTSTLYSEIAFNLNDNFITTVNAVACPFGDTETNPNCLPAVSQSIQQTGNSIIVNGIGVPNTGWNFDFGSNQTIYATAELSDVTNPGNVNPGSAITQFTYLTIPNSSPSSTLSQEGIYNIITTSGNGSYNATTTSGNLAIVVPYITPSSTQPNINNWCPPDGNFFNPVADIGYGICQAVQFSFNPNVLPIAQSYFQNSVNQLKSVPPFVAFYAVASSTEGGLESFANATSNGVTVDILGYNHGTLVNQQLFTINSTTFFGGFSSSTNNVANNQAANNNLEFYIDTWLWIAAAIRILHIYTIA